MCTLAANLGSWEEIFGHFFHSRFSFGCRCRSIFEVILPVICPLIYNPCWRIFMEIFWLPKEVALSCMDKFLVERP